MEQGHDLGSEVNKEQGNLVIQLLGQERNVLRKEGGLLPSFTLALPGEQKEIMYLPEIIRNS